MDRIWTIRALGAVSLVALTGCLGGGGGGGGVVDPVPLTFSEMNRDGDVLAAAFARTTITSPATLPTSGTAVYRGFADIDPNPGGTILGQMDMAVNFGTNRVSGEIDNLRTANSTIPGQITIANGVINRDAGTNFAAFEVDLGGSITDGQGRLAVSGDMDGAFHQQGALVGARGDGQFTGPGRNIPFDIQVVGER
jgi:hypothetical protein